MSDNITLPREVVEYLMETMEELSQSKGWFCSERDKVVLPALRTALAAEQPKQEPVAMFDERMGQPVLLPRSPMLEDGQFLYTAPPAPAPEDIEDLRRDAERYRWLLKWLVWRGLLSLERCRIDTPESYGDWWILRKPKVIDGSSLIGYGKTEDGAIDAAMQEDKT